MSQLLGRELTAEEQAAQAAILKAGSGMAAMRAVAERRPEAFFGAAASLLERLGREQAVNLCRVGMEADPHFDIRLARLLPRRGQDESGIGAGAILRVLDVLNEISAGARLVFMLARFTSHSNPQIASKAALLVGQRIQNPAWVEEHFLSEDARLRANVIEALWGQREAWARRLIRRALRDENNRVAGNAVMGLWFAGDPNFSELAGRMLRDARPAFRQTAAWVMGRSGDPAFLEPLRAALSDSAPDVRRSARRALVAIRRPIVKREAASPAAPAGAAKAAERERPAAEAAGAGVEWSPRLDGKYISLGAAAGG